MTQYTKDFFDSQKDGSYASAQAVVPLVMGLVSPKSVVDIGCGVGTWLSVFQKNGVIDVLGVDGEWVNAEQLFIPRERFIPKDFEKPFTIKKKADLVVCLEMAEHIPDTSADGLVESLVRIAPVVLFSAAIPLQEGVHHINEQWPSYWAERFKKHGYIPVDCIRRNIWTNENVRFWYAQNTFLYVNEKHLSHYPKLEEEVRCGNNVALALVHPTKYLQAIERYYLLLPLLKLIPKPLKQFTRKTLSFLRRKDLSALRQNSVT